MGMARSTNGEKKNAYKLLVERGRKHTTRRTKT
jgi:hypothetical protein